MLKKEFLTGYAGRTEKAHDPAKAENGFVPVKRKSNNEGGHIAKRVKKYLDKSVKAQGWMGPP